MGFRGQIICFSYLFIDVFQYSISFYIVFKAFCRHYEMWCDMTKIIS